MTQEQQNFKECTICYGQIDVQFHPTTEAVIWSEGHNAEPVTSGRCCSKCNLLYVIPQRLSQARI